MSAYEDPCQACGAVATTRPYGAFLLCMPCKRLAGSWCWAKLQGLAEADVLPRHGDIGGGKTYDCTLCGYWHWTSSERVVPADMAVKIGQLEALFSATGFHINAARGWSRIRHPADPNRRIA